jgi:hypothetical protein
MVQFSRERHLRQHETVASPADDLAIVSEDQVDLCLHHLAHEHSPQSTRVGRVQHPARTRHDPEIPVEPQFRHRRRLGRALCWVGITVDRSACGTCVDESCESRRLACRAAPPVPEPAGFPASGCLVRVRPVHVHVAPDAPREIASTDAIGTGSGERPAVKRDRGASPRPT